MIIPNWTRLLLYIGMAVLPVWIEFFTKSTDYTLRGLAMPALSSALAAITVTLARTTAKTPEPPPDK